MNFSNETIQVLLFLAPGYLAYRLYKIDSVWAQVPLISIAYGSLAFSAIAYVSMGYVTTDETSQATKVIWTFSFALVAGIIWRRFGHRLFHETLRRLKITNEDNSGDVWQKMFNDPRIFIRQVRVYLKNDDAFACDDTRSLVTRERARIGIHPYYTNQDRQIGFIPTHRKLAGATDWEALADIDSAEWGIRYIYFNSSEIARVEVRLADSSSRI